MKVLSISRQGHELVNAVVASPTVLIGRSPTCDVILRAKGVKPIHFLVEWVGVGEFGEDDEGVWTVFDISATTTGRPADADSAAGLGVIIGDKPVEAGGFNFRFRTDRLKETRLAGGAIH